MKNHSIFLAFAWLLGATFLTLQLNAAPATVAHPFILWNRQDIAAIRAKLDTQDWAKTRLAELRKWRGPGEVFRNLFLISVLGDAKVAAAEKQYLLSFIGAKVDPRPWSDQYLSALRYDALYDQLTPDERQRLEATFRRHIQWELTQDHRTYTRTSWLPNMQWPRKTGAMLMAVALQDETLIRGLFNGNGGWKYYFDDYIADGCFYNEEFGKQYSVIGEMLLWCRGLERLGLNELGYGYTGKGGATMRRYLESIHLVGYPRVDLGTDRPHYPKMTMGDAKGKTKFPGYAFQQPIVTGYLADGTGGDKWFQASNMNGRDHKNRKVEKLMRPMWFEIAHRKWPEAHFDYFLAQMRAPQDDRYFPTLFWGLDPIDPAKVTAPPAPSAAYPERGIAVLRWNETPAYWKSPEPAVTMRLATEYVHEVPDVFALIGYYAFNRPIYLNRQQSAGYAGTDPGWSSSIRSHASVQVDGLEPRRIGELPARTEFNDLVKFVAVTGKDIYPGVEQTRALMLTREYLLDVFALASARPRSYQWEVHTLGHACPDNPGEWAATRHLVGTLFDVAREQSCVTDNTWAVTSTQYTGGADPELSGLGERWFDPPHRIGVRLTMLGEPGTIAYRGLGPAFGGAKERIVHGATEPGGVTLAAARTKSATVFIALHEPFQGHARIRNFRELARVADAVVVEIGSTDAPVHDLAMVRWGPAALEPITLVGPGGAFRFRDHAMLRAKGNRLEASGGLEAFRLPAEGWPGQLLLNGKTVSTDTTDGQWGFGAQLPEPPAAAPSPAVKRPIPIEVRWFPEMVRLATGGRATATLYLRNLGAGNIGTTVNGRLRAMAPKGIRVEPSVIELNAFAAGGELTVPLKVAAQPDTPARLDELLLAAEGNAAFVPQPTPLRLSHGVTWERSQLWPRDFAATVYAPRYVLQFHYLESTAAALILDPLGWRRSDGGVFRPEVLSPASADSKSRAKWTPLPLGFFQAFKPVSRTTKSGERFLADMGTHPHGYSSPFEWRFHEDWVIVKLRQPTGDRVAFDWSPGSKFRLPGVNAALAKSQNPGIALYADGQDIADKKPKEGSAVRAVFERWSGFEYGQATFYPPGSTLLREGKVAQPAAEPMAFTFCTEQEFPAFVKRWQSRSGLVYVKPWGQGDLGK